MEDIISRLVTETKYRTVETLVDFSVHPAGELERAMESIGNIKNVDEVTRVDIEGNK